MLGHLIVGAAIGVWIAVTPGDLLWILFGSILIDFDHRSSTLGRFNPLNRWKKPWWCCYQPWKRWGSRDQHRHHTWMKHRGKCHTILGCILLSFPFYFISIEAFYFVWIGTLTHLIGDKIHSWIPTPCVVKKGKKYKRIWKRRRQFRLRLW